MINNYFKKHWFIYTLILAIPTVWFSVILSFWGETLKLYHDSAMTGIGNVITGFLIIPIACVVLVNNWYASKSEIGQMEKLRGEVDYLGTINENVDQICDEKFDQLRKTIVEVKAGKIDKPRIVTKPSNQLKRIINGMTSCLVKFSEIPGQEYCFKDFSLSIAYNFPMENYMWEWVEGMKENDLSLADLLSNDCKSTYRYLIDSKQPYYFNNRKEDARKEHRYHYSKQDELNEELGEPVGSIFCYNFKIKKGSNIYVDAYLSISTNKKRFAIENVEICKNTRENMISLVRDTFGKRISIELCLLYLEYLKCITSE